MEKRIQRKLFLICFIVGLTGIIAGFPYVWELNGSVYEEAGLGFGVAFVAHIGQNTVGLLIAIAIGIFLGKKVSLGLPIIEKQLRRETVEVKWSVFFGFTFIMAVLAVILLAINGQIQVRLFPELVETIGAVESPVWWKGLLASLYGGVFEEMLLRFGMVSLIAWLLHKIFRKNDQSSSLIWISILIAAILFGVGHLPLAATLVDLNAGIVINIIVGNAIGGIIFGWLFWKRGLEAAIITHWFADILLHVVVPLIS